MAEGACELPRYRSHKAVWAFKIATIKDEGDDGSTLYPVDDDISPVRVTREYMEHVPSSTPRSAPRRALGEGGYWVRYSDGYESWSPAEVFEERYTRISDDDETKATGAE